MKTNATRLSRRGMLKGCAGSMVAVASASQFFSRTSSVWFGESLIAIERSPDFDQDALLERAYGLLLGSMIGDALGGPTEFQPVRWTNDFGRSCCSRAALTNRLDPDQNGLG
jgi:hypothetical protein